MSSCNTSWFTKMSNIRCSLTWFSSSHHYSFVYWTESINHYFTLYRLNWVNYHSNCSGVQHFLRLLCLYISTWQPRSKTRMWVVPTNTNLISSNLFHHFHKLLLIDRVNWFHRHSCSDLRHRKNINNTYCVFIKNCPYH